MVHIATNKHITYRYNSSNDHMKEERTLVLYDIVKDKEDQLWAGSIGGILKLNDDGWECLTCDSLNLNAVRKQQQQIFAILVDSKDRVWFGGLQGLGRYTDNKIVYDNNGQSLLNTRVTDISETANQMIVVSTRGEGVLFLAEDTIYQIKEADGLASDNILHITIDDDIIWLSTNKGLNKISFIDYEKFWYEIETYDITDGLVNNEVNETVVLNNELWVGTKKGLSIFKPNEVGPNSMPPPIYLTGIQGAGSSYAIEQDYNLAYDQNNFVLNFIGLSYKDPGNLTYQYKMNGVDSIWLTTTNTSVQYTTLPYGQYEFQVKAINHDGFASIEAASVRFKINTPFWHTWWFRLLYVMMIAGVIYLTIRIRVNQITRKAKAEEQQNQKMAEMELKTVEMELKALRAQMNPHFTFNTMNSIQQYIGNHDPDSAQRYLTKFARLIRSILDNSELGLIPIKEELKSLELYIELEKMRFEDQFDYEITVDKTVDEGYDRIPPMLIQPYVENAIWHGLQHKKGMGKIKIELKNREGRIKCSIEDNGIGREKAQELKGSNQTKHKSFGMMITKERLEILNSMNNSGLSVNVIDLKDPKGNVAGTKVEIFIPIS